MEDVESEGEVSRRRKKTEVLANYTYSQHRMNIAYRITPKAIWTRG